MAKKPRAHHKKQVKWLMPALISLIVLLVALLIVNAFLPKQTAGNNDQVQIMVTEEGHVHTTDGQHLGTYEEIFGQPWPGVDGLATPAEGETAEPTAEPAAPTEAPAN